jgi:hypothetical protein
MHVATTTMCVNNARMMKRWAPFGPPDEFNASNGTASAAWVLASRGGRGDAGESTGREIQGPYLLCNWGHGVPHKHTMVMC